MQMHLQSKAKYIFYHSSLKLNTQHCRKGLNLKLVLNLGAQDCLPQHLWIISSCGEPQSIRFFPTCIVISCLGHCIEFSADIRFAIMYIKGEINFQQA